MTRGQIDATDRVAESIEDQTETIKMLGIHLDRLATAIEDQTEAHREMTEYIARAIDSHDH